MIGELVFCASSPVAGALRCDLEEGDAKAVADLPALHNAISPRCHKIVTDEHPGDGQKVDRNREKDLGDQDNDRQGKASGERFEVFAECHVDKNRENHVLIHSATEDEDYKRIASFHLRDVDEERVWDEVSKHLLGEQQWLHGDQRCLKDLLNSPEEHQ